MIKVNKSSASNKANSDKAEKSASENKKQEAKTKAASASANANATAEKKSENVKPVEKKASVKKEARSAEFTNRMKYAAELALSKKFTDEEIIAKVLEKFTEYKGPLFNQKELGRARWMLYIGKIEGLPNLGDKPEERAKCAPMVRIDGKLIPKSEKPKAARVSKKKYNPDNDPLAKIGVNVHKEKATAESSAKVHQNAGNSDLGKDNEKDKAKHGSSIKREPVTPQSDKK